LVGTGAPPLVSTTTTLSASVNPIAYGQSASVTATVSPASGTTTPTGTVALTIDGSAVQNAALSGGTAGFTIAGLLAGPHSFAATYGGSTIFAGSSTSSNLPLTVTPAVLTVTGACGNRIFLHGASYQLTARATSGLPVSYSVLSGNATVSGSTLTVTGTGPVTVQASQSTDPTGDYAPATPVSESFTAQ